MENAVDVSSWYEICLINGHTGSNIGTISQPIPPSVGDRFCVLSEEYVVTSRTFDYNVPLKVVIFAKTKQVYDMEVRMGYRK